MDEALIALAQVAGEPYILAVRAVEFVVYETTCAAYLTQYMEVPGDFHLDPSPNLAFGFHRADLALAAANHYAAKPGRTHFRWEILRRTRVVLLSDEEVVERINPLPKGA